MVKSVFWHALSEKMKDRRVLIQYSQGSVSGSREHFFHFLLGYLLPGLYAAGVHRSSFDFSTILEFMDCGPLMNERISDACNALGIQHVIKRGGAGGDPRADQSRSLRAPRWDGRLCSCKRSAIRLRHWPEEAILKILGRSTAASIQQFRDFFLRATVESGLQIQKREWLLLRRSAQPDYYSKSGGSEKPGYGMKRRSILNIDSLAEELATAGWPVRIYEPGTANLVEQASTFHHCAGVIGIRGAELANIVWMRPGAKVLMLANPVGIENYGAFNLANTLKVGFDQLMVSNRFPSVSASEIIQRLSV
jgi:hypothetical protein